MKAGVMKLETLLRQVNEYIGFLFPIGEHSESDLKCPH